MANASTGSKNRSFSRIRKRGFAFPLKFGGNGKVREVKRTADPRAPLDRQDSTESKWSAVSSLGSRDSEASPKLGPSNYLSVRSSSEIGDTEYVSSGAFTSNGPISSIHKLILPLWSVTVQGLFHQKLRRMDSKILKRLDIEIQKTLLDLVNNLSLFDIEMANDSTSGGANSHFQRQSKSKEKEIDLNHNNKNNESKAAEPALSKRKRFLKQLSKLTGRSFDSDVDSDANSDDNIPILVKGNHKLAQYGLSATLCKEEQRLIGANTFLYFLEVTTLENPEVNRLPLRRKKEVARKQASGESTLSNFCGTELAEHDSGMGTSSFTEVASPDTGDRFGNGASLQGSNSLVEHKPASSTPDTIPESEPVTAAS